MTISGLPMWLIQPTKHKSVISNLKKVSRSCRLGIGWSQHWLPVWDELGLILLFTAVPTSPHCLTSAIHVICLALVGN